MDVTRQFFNAWYKINLLPFLIKSIMALELELASPNQQSMNTPEMPYP
jgi:hypothetical protein